MRGKGSLEAQARRRGKTLHLEQLRMASDSNSTEKQVSRKQKQKFISNISNSHNTILKDYSPIIRGRRAYPVAPLRQQQPHGTMHHPARIEK